ncbi:hypothetical protein [Ewingella americana]|uniref:Tail fiber protein n=1 Tax=Ewingella americana TaxID=41202 RepID=A0A502GGP0_9GAMM|nr:hypothetical protein [Ewingella americana]TPG60126.1 hypothetical protein EAH77_16285 [Ewingella americana]
MEIKVVTSNYLTKSNNPVAYVQLTPTDYNRMLVAIRRRVKKDGDTLTGALLNYAQDPTSTNPLELVSRYFVDHGDALVQNNLNTHVAATDVHGATSNSTASRLIIRDATGRAQVANAINPLEIVNLQTMQAGDKAVSDDLIEHIVDPTNPHPNATTDIATPSMLIIRDINGRAEVRDADLTKVNQIVNVTTLNTVADNKIAAHNKETTVHGATSDNVASRIIIRDANGQAKVGNPTEDDHIANFKSVKDSNTALKAHIDNADNPHPKAADTAATAGKLALRTANGQIKAADPKEDDDVVTKKFMLESNSSAVSDHAKLTTAHGAVPDATANRIIIRDASGRAKIADPSAVSEIANLGTVNAVRQMLEDHIDDGTNPHPEASTYGAVANMLALRNANGNIQVGWPGTDSDAANVGWTNASITNLRNVVAVINPGAPKQGDELISNNKLYFYIAGGWRQVWPSTYS